MASRCLHNPRVRGQLPLSRVLGTLGKDPIHLPSRVLRGALRLSQNLKAYGFTEAQLDYIMYSCMLDTTRADRKLGFRPSHDIQDCIEEARHCITEEP